MKVYYLGVLSVLLSVLLINPSNAQSFGMGYIITNTGDTLRGQVANLQPQQRATTVIFKADKDAPKQTFSTKDLAGFQSEAGTFIRDSIRLSRTDIFRPFFLAILADGDYNLYRLTYNFNQILSPAKSYQLGKREVPNANPDDTERPSFKLPPNKRGVWYFMKVPVQDIPVLIRPDNYEEVLVGLLSPCPEGLPKRSYKYLDREVVQMSMDLAACQDKTINALIDLSPPKRKTQIGIGLGIYQTEINSGMDLYFEDVDFPARTVPVFSLLAEIPFLDRLAVETGAEVRMFSTESSISYTVNEFYPNEGEVLSLNQRLNFAILNMPAYLKYYFREQPANGLYAKVGLAFGWNLGNSGYTEVIGTGRNANNELIQIPERRELQVGTTQIMSYELGALAGLGYNYRLGKHRLSAEVIYRRSQSFNYYGVQPVNTFRQIAGQLIFYW